jgi:hypothetical protein
MRDSVRVASGVLAAAVLFGAGDPDRDFSGHWVLDHVSNNLSVEAFPTLTLTQDDALHCIATTAAGAEVRWTYRLNRDESEYNIGAEVMNSVAKWEGAALLISTLVSGPQSYSLADRWMLAHDRSTLTIHRQVMRGTAETEADLVYRRAGAPLLTSAQPALRPPALASRPAPSAAPPVQYVVPAGTHILLSLSNSVSTKNSTEGQHVYLETSVPVAQQGRIVIPRGSYVQGAITKTKPAGRMNDKAELYIRFETLTLPNGVTRDFRARLNSADAAPGKVDSDEGKISGEKSADGGKVVRDVGIGSVGGVILGGAAGHPGVGLGAGAAAGVAAVLLGKNKDVVLPRGTSVEMVLDRDLSFAAEELRR